MNTGVSKVSQSYLSMLSNVTPTTRTFKWNHNRIYSSWFRVDQIKENMKPTNLNLSKVQRADLWQQPSLNHTLQLNTVHEGLLVVSYWLEWIAAAVVQMGRVRVLDISFTWVLAVTAAYGLEKLLYAHTNQGIRRSLNDHAPQWLL